MGVSLPAVPEDDGLFLVDPANWDAVTVFCQCSTQWRYGMMGGMIGLDYAGVDVVLNRLIKRHRRSAIFSALQIMERAAMDKVNAKLKK